MTEQHQTLTHAHRATAQEHAQNHANSQKDRKSPTVAQLQHFAQGFLADVHIAATPLRLRYRIYMLHRDGKTILIIIRSSSPIIFTKQGAVIDECTRHGFQGIVVPILSTYSLGALFAIRSTLILRYLILLFLPGLDKLYV